MIDRFGLQRFTVDIKMRHDHIFKYLFGDPIDGTDRKIRICRVRHLSSVYNRIENVKQIIKIQFPEIIFTPVCEKHIIAAVADCQQIFPVQFPACLIERLHPQCGMLLCSAQCQNICFFRKPHTGEHEIAIVGRIPVFRLICPRNHPPDLLLLILVITPDDIHSSI